MRVTYLLLALLLFFFAGVNAERHELISACLVLAGGLSILASALFREERS